MTLNYIKYFESIRLDPDHADPINEAAAVLTDRIEMERRTSSEFKELDALIDAMVDKVIVACKGEPRFVIYSLLLYHGMSMRLLAGPPGSARS